MTLKTALDVLTQYNTLLEGLIKDNEDYKLALKLENINKLNIIHKHHPKALKYFIGY